MCRHLREEGNGKCKGPEGTAGPDCSRNSKERSLQGRGRGSRLLGACKTFGFYSE